MSGMVAVASNAKRVSEHLASYIAETHADERQAVKMAARGVTNALLKLTPPFATLSPSESFGAQKKIGEFAVQRDIGRSFRSLKDLNIYKRSRNQRVRKNVEAAIDKGDPQLMADLLNKFGYDNMTPDMIIAAATADKHNAMRVNGRVPKGTKPLFVFDDDSLEKLLWFSEHGVGRAKSGWLNAANALGIAVPDWISRHGSNGNAHDGTEAVNNPSFRAANEVDYLATFGGEMRLVSMALEREAGNLERALIAKRAGLWEKKR